MTTMEDENELQQLREENKILNQKLMEQYAINNKLQNQFKKIQKKHPDNQHYNFERVRGQSNTELEPLSLTFVPENSLPLEIGQEQPHLTASSVNLSHQIKGGAFICSCCKLYAMRIYVHYWIWQIPIFVLNIMLCIIWLSDNDLNTELGFLAVGPVFFATLIRDKIFSWVVYWSIKHTICCTKYGRYHLSRLIDCIGGLHASFGVTAYLWNSIYFYDTFVDSNYKFNPVTITAFALPCLLFCICVSAAPCFRYHYHNYFELIHRYLNWLSLCVLILHVYFMNKSISDSNYELIIHLISNTPSIFAFGLVILTLYPWFIIHKIKSKNIEIIPSNSGISTAFIFPIWAPMGAVCKLSTNWREFHVMGITPLPFNEDKRYNQSLVLIKNLGDWSHELVQQAFNQQLNNQIFWIHRVKPPNFSQGLFNWNKVFALATGAGIAPLIPYVVNPKHFNVQISLVWVARDHENNYPKFIVDLLKPLQNVILYDTTKQKRPDLSLLTVEKAVEFNAEAVFIVSNPKTAYNVSNYVNKKGIPVFASNFDV